MTKSYYVSNYKVLFLDSFSLLLSIEKLWKCITVSCLNQCSLTKAPSLRRLYHSILFGFFFLLIPGLIRGDRILVVTRRPIDRFSILVPLRIPMVVSASRPVCRKRCTTQMTFNARVSSEMVTIHGGVIETIDPVGLDIKSVEG